MTQVGKGVSELENDEVWQMSELDYDVEPPS